MRGRWTLTYTLGLLVLAGRRRSTARTSGTSSSITRGRSTGSSWPRYPDAARLFNAFDYGHAVLYELLYTREGAPQRAALEREYRYLTTDLLVRPPRFAIAEEAVMPAYARLAWRAKQMFDWAHVLHRQIYDVYADERIAAAPRTRWWSGSRTTTSAARSTPSRPLPSPWHSWTSSISARCSGRQHPKFNGLIWAYHWLQVGLYEPLLVYPTPEERQAGVRTRSPASGRCCRSAARIPAGHADDSGDRARVRPAASAGGADLRQPAHDARHHLGRSRRRIRCRASGSAR